eukprot:scaffold256146_cov17-Tisochrysis_lutea.AAC.1
MVAVAHRRLAYWDMQSCNPCFSTFNASCCRSTQSLCVPACWLRLYGLLYFQQPSLPLPPAADGVMAVAAVAAIVLRLLRCLMVLLLGTGRENNKDHNNTKVESRRLDAIKLFGPERKRKNSSGRA